METVRIREVSLQQRSTVPSLLLFTCQVACSSVMHCLYPFFNDLNWRLLLRQFTTSQSTQIPVGASTFLVPLILDKQKSILFLSSVVAQSQKKNIKACAFVYLANFPLLPSSSRDHMVCQLPYFHYISFPAKTIQQFD